MFLDTLGTSPPAFKATIRTSKVVLSRDSWHAAAALIRGRSYDFLPALRGMQTGWLQRSVRHPMYASSILIRATYLLQNMSWFNVVTFAIMVWLYDCRAAREEDVMGTYPRYRAYKERVRYRFVPGFY
jgi:protein-S-isoprenylcysteine O-methyltransferase Ste14